MLILAFFYAVLIGNAGLVLYMWLEGFDKYKTDMHRFRPFTAIATTLAATLVYWIHLFDEPKTSLSITTIVGYLIPIILIVAATATATVLEFSRYLSPRYSKVCLKLLDFPYLIFAAFGLLRVINSSPLVAERLPSLDTYGILFIVIALGIRLAKTTLEVFFDDWVDRPKK